MKKIFIITICLIAAVILGYGIHYAVTPVSSQALELATHEKAAAAKGYIVRDEIAYYADRSGRLYNNAAIGARVAKDSLIYTIYDNSVDASVISELNTLDKQIADAKAANAAGYSSGTISVESEIASRTEQIIEAARKNDIASIAQYKKDINSLRQTGAIVSSEDEIAELEGRKASIEAQIGNGRSERFAENSGVFTIYYDGLEDVLSKDKVGEYTVEYIESLGEAKARENRSDTVEQGGFVCNIANNHTWYVLLVLEADKLYGYEAGDTVTVRFNNIALEKRDGKIAYISSEEQNKDGRCFVLIECSEYFEGAYSYRNVDADIIFESYSGYKVPSQSIRQDGERQYVIGISDNRQFECDVKILYSNADESYAIVNSTDDAEHMLSSADRILVGER